tara:strand:+ start:68 stop:379 length:312 start_codon:yes stop_codon:yes gene_type:complete
MIAKPTNIIVVENQLAIKWNDGKESFVDCKKLRLSCPCAKCSGESDIFGNKYINKDKKPNSESNFVIINYEYVGHYAIRFLWGDGHNSGIYSFNFLRDLNDSK